tara:strand:- start:29 stop:157 length:129 start_codon:yes stop_codon:yes gene_type:complete
MKNLIELLQEIDNDFYKGVYTVGEYSDLVRDINKMLKNKKFI